MVSMVLRVTSAACGRQHYIHPETRREGTHAIIEHRASIRTVVCSSTINSLGKRKHMRGSVRPAGSRIHFFPTQRTHCSVVICHMYIMGSCVRSKRLLTRRAAAAGVSQTSANASHSRLLLGRSYARLKARLMHEAWHT
jgi:hypothetical protein